MQTNKRVIRILYLKVQFFNVIYYPQKSDALVKKEKLKSQKTRARKNA